jgi:hypothetical protein
MNYKVTLPLFYLTTIGRLQTEPCVLGSSQPLKMSTRDFSWGKGGRCVRLTTYHPRSAERQENPAP